MFFIEQIGLSTESRNVVNPTLYSPVIPVSALKNINTLQKLLLINIENDSFLNQNLESKIMEQDYYGYVYVTIDQKHNKVYVGQKKGKIEDSKNYYGSGIRIPRIIKKRGTYFLKKIILGTCDSLEELTEQETECKYFFDAFDERYGYNIAIIDYIPMAGRKHTEETKKILSEKNKGKTLLKETKDKISISMKGVLTWNKGLTKETNDILLNISKKMKIKNKGKNHPFYGKNHTKKSKNKMSESHIGQISGMKGKKHTEESKQKISKNSKGKKAWNIGISPTDKTKEKISKSIEGRKWIINSKGETKQIKQDEIQIYLENNWKLGRKNYESI